MSSAASPVVVHEKQVRQLCAIHTVNNLLQLPSDLFGEEATEVNEEPTPSIIVHEWSCHGKILHRYKQSCACDKSTNTSDATGTDRIPWRVATQEEFDDIAKEFTLREEMLMSGDESTFLSTTSSAEEVKSSGTTKDRLSKISVLQRVRSNYSTPYYGNYNKEVIEEALKRRGVELEWAGKDVDANLTSQNPNTYLIGFIIYMKEENPRGLWTLLNRIGSHIPLVKHFCGFGQHWFAITGVRYNQHNDDDAPHNSKDCNDSTWSLIDSKMDGIHIFHTDEGLINYVREVQQGQGGLVFRAFTECKIDGK